MIKLPMLGAMLIALAGALPAAAQTPPAPPAPPAMVRPPMPPMPPLHGDMMRFGSMSEAGRKAMMTAMMGDRAASRADHDRVRAARDRMLATLDAERVDAAALRRAMDDEREAANAMKARHQAAMATALLSLSAADRKAFVEDARSLRTRIERRVERRIERRGGHGKTTMMIMRHGRGDAMEPMEPSPPPPPLPAR